LFGVGITSLVISIVSKKTLKITNVLVIYIAWLLSFALFYFSSLREIGSNNDLLKSWGEAFPSSPLDIIWLLDALGKFFYKPLGFASLFDGIAIFAFVLGCISYYHRRQATLAILLSPLFATFAAAYLQKYPFRGRLVLFLTPFFILLIAEGVDYLFRKKNYKLTTIAGSVILFLLLIQPIVSATSLLVNPFLKEEIKPVISYVKSHQQSGDIIYIFQRGRYQFEYYAKKYGYQEGDYIIGVEDLDNYDGKRVSEEEWQRYKSDLDKLRGNQRVWVVFSHAHLRQENEMVNAYLEQIGKRIDSFQAPGAFVYLYDLSNK
jgi:hypothetical protein